MESEFRFQWGSQKLELIIQILNLVRLSGNLRGANTKGGLLDGMIRYGVCSGNRPGVLDLGANLRCTYPELLYPPPKNITFP
jgi:hypothetical protein